MTVGIICEYNPLHLGHQKQIDLIRQHFGPETVIICAMSGNFVQRGMPAIIDKGFRAQAAVLSGADLVLELPTTVSLSSAEGFAAGGVALLSKFCDYLCFGAETPQEGMLMDTARALLSEGFPPLLKLQLESGKSFPAARQAALAQMGLNADILAQPNNILAVEYCKAILVQGCAMKPWAIHREGSYHAEIADSENPSATAVRNLMLIAHNWKSCVPAAVRSVFENAPLHTIEAGQRAILARLRTMSDAEFEALPYGSEGLWRKFMYACRTEASLEAIIAATKSKRYTRTRIDRMVMCAFLGITRETVSTQIPYVRVLAFREAGRQILSQYKKEVAFVNAGENPNHPFWEKEKLWGSLYGLFAAGDPDVPAAEESQRVFYYRSSQHMR